MSSSTKNGHFINGRSQVVELLKGLTVEEKNKILKGLYNINPAMANELSNESVTFDQLEDYSQDHLKIIFRNISPTIIGMALKGTNKRMQKRVLSLLGNHDAEEAFAVMIEKVTNEQAATNKAQNKVLENLSRMNYHQYQLSGKIN